VENDEVVEPKTRITWAGLASFMIFMVMWVAGWVLAKGFWSTLFSVIFFPWGWYLVVEKIMIAYGLA
jgi:hypothetical protein